jgi:hypothetical protein
MSEQKEESKSVRVDLKSYQDIQFLREEFAKQVGFMPSITQVIEYLVSKEMKGKETL